MEDKGNKEEREGRSRPGHVFRETRDERIQKYKRARRTGWEMPVLEMDGRTDAQVDSGTSGAE